MADFSPKDQQKLQKALETIDQSNQLQSQLFDLTDLCFEQCIKKPSVDLSRPEKACLMNCTNRFFDATMVVMNSFKDSNK